MKTATSRAARLGGALAASLMLAACGSPAPPRFHSLMPAQPSVGAVPSAAALAWQLLPVSVPAQVDQPQFVVRRADDTFTVLEQERWIAPLNDEIRAALSEHLTATLGAPGAVPASGRKNWRIALDVQRFDSTPGRTTLVAQWALLAGPDTPALRCRGVHEQNVGSGVPAMAGGHRRAVERLGAEISLALTALDAGRAGGCPAATP